MPPTKSRAREARHRRRLLRERTRLLELAANRGRDESSDEDIVPQRLETFTEEATPEQRASSVKSHHKPQRRLRGRRLLYGSSRLVRCSDDSSDNNGSFTDNEAIVPSNEGIESGAPDLIPGAENDYGLHIRPVSTTDNSNSSDENEPETLKGKIASYVIKNSVSTTGTKELLEMFAFAGIKGLPNNRRSLLQTPRNVGDSIVDKCGGTYYYVGLEEAFTNFLSSNPTFPVPDNTINFDVNIDGVPLHKSTNQAFWPLLCQIGRFHPFIVAIFYGKSKPNDIREYLEDFLDDYRQLHEMGFVYKGIRYNVNLRCWICDAPARSFLKCIKGHSGYYACERCKVEGIRIANKIIYPTHRVFQPRTDEEFSEIAYHNAADGDTHQTGNRTPLIDIGLKCVSGVVIDVMHNVHLGTWKRFLHFLKAGPRECRLSMNQLRQIDEKLLRLRLPREFVRQPRSIFDLERWKATELRSSLLYTGFVFLRDILSDDLYRLYLKLAVAMNILHTDDDDRRSRLLNFAHERILEFIKDSSLLLGNDFVVYNVHCMSHIAEDVRENNTSVNSINAFPFENHLQTIKKMVRGPTNPLAQVCARLEERKRHGFHQSRKALVSHISTSTQDSMFYFDNTHEFAMVQRKRRCDGRYDVLVFSTDGTQDLFNDPCPSKLVNIFLVRNLDNHRATPRIVSKTDLLHKVVLLACPNGKDYVLIPMLHENEIWLEFWFELSDTSCV